MNNKDRIMEAVDIVFEDRRRHVVMRENIRNERWIGDAEYHEARIQDCDKVMAVLLEIYDRLNDTTKNGKKWVEVLEYA